MFDKTILEYLKLRPTQGDVGIEVEVELMRGVSETIFNQDLWLVEEDNSLHGNGYEFVSPPLQMEAIEPAIGDLLGHILDKDNEILDSVRAGVHVHLNAQSWTVGQLFKFLCVYYPLEIPLTRFCGKGREGNLFCLRGTDASAIITRLGYCVDHSRLNLIHGDFLRYAALNLQSLFKFGTVEFRALRTEPDLSNIVPWCNLIKSLEDYALNNVQSCWDIPSEISGNGPSHWAKQVVGEELFPLIDYEGMDLDILRGLRNAQMLIYKLKKAGL